MKESLTKNFTLIELLRSQTADRWGFKEQYEPPMQVINNLQDLCVYILQPIRDALGRPIRITSGYRCPRVNAKVGGVSYKDPSTGKVVQSSQHVYGQAADIECWVNGMEVNNLIIDAIKTLIKQGNFEFDQIILEYGTLNNPSWIHVSYNKTNNRKQILRKEKGKPYTKISL